MQACRRLSSCQSPYEPPGKTPFIPGLVASRPFEFYQVAHGLWQFYQEHFASQPVRAFAPGLGSLSSSLALHGHLPSSPRGNVIEAEGHPRG